MSEGKGAQGLAPQGRQDLGKTNAITPLEFNFGNERNRLEVVGFNLSPIQSSHQE
jgi:hypothetical protein